MVLAHRRGWMQHGSRRLATLALALLAFLVASEAGGNPFVAAFVGGLVFGAAARADAAESIELTELAGSLLSLVLWFIFGAGFVLPAFEDLDVRIAVYAVISLTVVRMVPVAIALLGSGQGRATIAFVGWFGPRGLASVVFALLAVEELGDADPRVAVAVNTIAVTIVLSVVAHGITARPLATRYVRALRAGVRSYEADRERGDPDGGADEDDAADDEQRLPRPRSVQLGAHAGEEQGDGEQDHAEHVVPRPLDVPPDRRRRSPRLRRRSVPLRRWPASRYSSMANGVGGASGFVSGSVASQASNAGRNSARKRSR